MWYSSFNRIFVGLDSEKNAVWNDKDISDKYITVWMSGEKNIVWQAKYQYKVGFIWNPKFLK